MAKVLLLNNILSIPLPPTLDEPVQHNLVCWLDARDYNSGTVWEDRTTNNLDFTVPANITKVGGALVKNSAPETFYRKPIVGKLSKDFTLSVVIKPSETVTHHLFSTLFGQGAYTSSTGVYIGFKTLSADKKLDVKEWLRRDSKVETLVKSNIFPVDGKFHMLTVRHSVGEQKCDYFIDGIKIATTTRVQFADVDEDVVGTILMSRNSNDGVTPSNGDPLYGSIGSFMFYDRALSDDEIAHNNEYESLIDREKVEIEVLPVYDIVNTYSSWAEKKIVLEWKCDAKDSTIDYFRVQRDSTLKGMVNVRTYTDTDFNRGVVLQYVITPFYINGEAGSKASLTVRAPRELDSSPTTIRVEKILKSTIKNKTSFRTEKPYVVFMPCNSYYMGDTEDVEIIEID